MNWNLFYQNIELKVELESMKRDLAEKQELLVSASWVMLKWAIPVMKITNI